MELVLCDLNMFLRLRTACRDELSSTFETNGVNSRETKFNRVHHLIEIFRVFCCELDTFLLKVSSLINVSLTATNSYGAPIINFLCIRCETSKSTYGGLKFENVKISLLSIYEYVYSSDVLMCVLVVVLA